MFSARAIFIEGGMGMSYLPPLPRADSYILTYTPTPCIVNTPLGKVLNYSLNYIYFSHFHFSWLKCFELLQDIKNTALMAHKEHQKGSFLKNVNQMLIKTVSETI